MPYDDIARRCLPENQGDGSQQRLIMLHHDLGLPTSRTVSNKLLFFNRGLTLMLIYNTSLYSCSAFAMRKSVQPITLIP
jgi:hypothetical protein